MMIVMMTMMIMEMMPVMAVMMVMIMRMRMLTMKRRRSRRRMTMMMPVCLHHSKVFARASKKEKKAVTPKVVLALFLALLPGEPYKNN